MSDKHCWHLTGQGWHTFDGAGGEDTEFCCYCGQDRTRRWRPTYSPVPDHGPHHPSAMQATGKVYDETPEEPCPGRSPKKDNT